MGSLFENTGICARRRFFLSLAAAGGAAFFLGYAGVAGAQAPSFDFSLPDKEVIIEETRNKAIRESVTLSTSPQYPGLREEVTVRLESALTDLMRANVSWYVNGSLRERGVGARSIITRTGKPGERLSVRAVIMTMEGLSVEKQVGITPIDLELAWEAQTYTPPFYKGKALPTGKSKIRIAALPGFVSSGGSPLSPGALVYLWKSGDTKLLSASGYGKNVLEREMPVLLRNEEISVEVSSVSGSLTAESGVAISPERPRIVFYENNPIEGVRYQKAIGASHRLAGTELSVKAEPYFVSAAARAARKIAYDWTLNRRSVSTDSDEVVTLRQTEEAGSGSSVIALSLKNPLNIFERASASFEVLFGKP